MLTWLQSLPMGLNWPDLENLKLWSDRSKRCNLVHDSIRLEQCLHFCCIMSNHVKKHPHAYFFLIIFWFFGVAFFSRNAMRNCTSLISQVNKSILLFYDNCGLPGKAGYGINVAVQSIMGLNHRLNLIIFSVQTNPNLNPIILFMNNLISLLERITPNWKKTPPCERSYRDINPM